MATIIKTDEGVIEIEQLNQSTPTRIINWSNVIFNVQETPEDDFIINIQFSPSQNFTFGSWKYTTKGILTSIDGVDIEDDTKEQIEDKLQALFSTPVIE
jgi:hypothetical protein